MRLNTIFYILGQGFKGIFRNKVMTTACLLVLMACMILVGTFYLVIDTIDRNLQDIEDLRVIEVMMNKDYDEAQILEIGHQLADICNDSPIIDWNSEMWTSNVTIPKTPAFTYVSPDEHLNMMLETYEGEAWINDIFERDKEHDAEHDEGENDGIVSGIKDNPLRGSYRITFESFSDMDEVYRIRTRIGAMTVTDKDGNIKEAVPMDDIKNNIELYGNVMSIKNTLYIVGIWLMGIFLVISLFVIMNTIKLGVSARENEIKFMRLCGATKRFIRMPFIVEGVIIGLIAAVFAFGVEFWLYEYLLKGIIESTTSTANGVNIQSITFMEYAPVLAIGFAAIGLFAGVVASGISMKKFLKA